MQPKLYRETPAWLWAAFAVVLAEYLAIGIAMLLAPDVRLSAFILGANTALLVALLRNLRRPALLAAGPDGLRIVGVAVAPRGPHGSHGLRGVRLVTAPTGLVRGRVRAVLVDRHGAPSLEIALGARAVGVREFTRVLAKLAPGTRRDVVVDREPGSHRPDELRAQPRLVALPFVVAVAALALAVAGIALGFAVESLWLAVLGGAVGAGLLPLGPAVVAGAVADLVGRRGELRAVERGDRVRFYPDAGAAIDAPLTSIDLSRSETGFARARIVLRDGRELPLGRGPAGWHGDHLLRFVQERLARASIVPWDAVTARPPLETEELVRHAADEVRTLWRERS